jgi:DNA polymerase-1
MFLTGKDNFRKKIRDDYKGTRKKRDKPKHYQAVRDYLVSQFQAQVVDGMEADDALSLQQKPDHSTAIATIDKDLLMVEGLHYNYNTKEWKKVSDKQGTRFFYKQMLTGDRVDNITGIRGIGDKKADKLLDEHNDWDKLIVDMYLDEFDNGFQRAVENSQLLWMLQRDKEMPIDFYEQAKI